MTSLSAMRRMSEDKDDVARPLAQALTDRHVAVWYDEYELVIGDSLRQKIDSGLATSRFGIVILSRSFFDKNWPQYELDGLVSREMLGDEPVLLPVWHDVDANYVSRYSPSLATRVAVSTADSIAVIVDAVLKVVHPQGSPLVIARDELISRGTTPPVITDEFWLDVLEASNRVPAYGAVVPEAAAWGRWSFPLPELDGTAAARGDRIAWTALQMAWTEAADARPIDLSTKPHVVVNFVESLPGLEEVCGIFPGFLAEYAPQLTIPGLGGDLESMIDEAYRKAVGDDTNTSCPDEWTLRHLRSSDLPAYRVAFGYFSSGMFGPEVRFYAHADYLFWLLSEESRWLPELEHGVLLRGLAQMSHAWLWWSHDTYKGTTYEGTECGALSNAFHDALEMDRTEIEWTDAVERDLITRANLAANKMSFATNGETLADAFRSASVLQEAFAWASDRRRRQTERT